MLPRSRPLWAAALFTFAAHARAQTPAGPEFRVNTYTTDSQTRPSVGMDASGAFVVTWNSNFQDGSGIGVFGQRFTRTGAPLGAEFRVNQGTVSNQYQWTSGMARAGQGAFLTVWQASDGSQDGVFGRRHDADGNPLGGDFAVNTYVSDFQSSASAVFLGPARSLVSWQSRGQDGSGWGIYAQRYDANGAREGAEFRVNSTTAGNQYRPQAAADRTGNFVVVWDGDGDGSDRGVFGQRFDAAGTPLGAEFRVNTYTTDRQFFPHVARTPGGSFVVVWSSYRQDGSFYGVFGQRFDAAGARAGGEFRVNTITTFSQVAHDVASDAAGGFVVTWRSEQIDYNNIFGQRYAPGGAAVGGEFRVNSHTTSNKDFGSVASDANGNLVFAWHSPGQDGQFFGVYGQRFGGLKATALATDRTGNGVLEPGETVAIEPSWLNFNGAPLTFGGGALSFGGPLGPTYSLVDAQAGYGTVANGATGGCAAAGDCYAVLITATSRPAAHWDATLLEQLQPAVSHGQTQGWTLHVGDSFTDVPRTNQFYRFVETLLHHAITGGCGQGLFCPQSATTREQMAVFVLVAREGSEYTPPACATPIFADVPASSPFCRWIEELFRRGVVSGCGGANYCPGDAVSREQMAVFVLRTLDPALSPPDCTTPVFADVPASSPFCRWIEELARRGVVSGCGGGNYCPTQPVTREQMGVFLGTTFGLTLYGP